MSLSWIGKTVPLSDIFKSFNGGIQNAKGRDYYLISSAPKTRNLDIVEFLIYKNFDYPPICRWIGTISNIKTMLLKYEKNQSIDHYYDERIR